MALLLDVPGVPALILIDLKVLNQDYIPVYCFPCFVVMLVNYHCSLCLMCGDCSFFFLF